MMGKRRSFAVLKNAGKKYCELRTKGLSNEIAIKKSKAWGLGTRLNQHFEASLTSADFLRVDVQTIACQMMTGEYAPKKKSGAPGIFAQPVIPADLGPKPGKHQLEGKIADEEIARLTEKLASVVRAAK
jgi:hypothetical protein